VKFVVRTQDQVERAFRSLLDANKLLLGHNGDLRSEDTQRAGRLRKSETLTPPVDCIKAPISRYDRAAGCA